MRLWGCVMQSFRFCVLLAAKCYYCKKGRRMRLIGLVDTVREEREREREKCLQNLGEDR